MSSRLAPDLAERIEQGGFDCVVTASQRLARAVLSHEAKRFGNQPDAVWQPQRTLPFSAFLRDCYRRWCAGANAIHTRGHHLLQSHQLDWVWSDIVSEALSAQASDYFGISGLATEARRAYTLLEQWRISDETLIAAARDEDSEFFATCLAHFRERALANGWVTESALPAFLAGIDPEIWFGTGTVLFAGFTDSNPAQSALIESLGTRAATWLPEVSGDRAPEVITRVADDAACYLHAGQSARRILDEAPESRIAIVSPTLSSDGASALRQVADGLFPGGAASDDDLRRRISVSVAHAVASYPAAAIALAWLDFVVDGVTFEGLSRLLRSPVFERREDFVAADLALRRMPDRLWRPDGVMQWMKSNDYPVPRWLDSAVRLSQSAGEDSRQTASFWAEQLSHGLEQAGWLDGTRLDSPTFQLRNAVFDTLNRLADGDAVSLPVTLAESVQRLRKIAGQSQHQAEAGTDDLLLCGPLETIGLDFDVVFLVGMDQQQWPPAANPCALLPRQLQREAGMPDASDEQAFAFWSYHTQRNLSVARDVNVSFAASRNEIELAPTLLIPVGRVGATDAPATIRSGMSDIVGLLDVDVTPGSLRPLPESARELGGHSVLHTMRADAMLAAVRHRWNCEPLEQPGVGIGPALRGTLLHRAVDRLYRGIESQAVLSTLGDAAINERIEAAVREAFRPEFVYADKTLTRLLRLEEARAQGLVARLVEFDLHRPGFRITALEQKRQLALGPLALNIRLDRVDDIAGYPLIIDYKSGELKTACQLEDLPDQHMQLVAYALSLPENVAPAGLALFSLGYHPNEALLWADEDLERWQGAVSRRDIADMPSLLNDWRAMCESLAMRFVDGDIRTTLTLQHADALPWLMVTRVNSEQAGD